MTDGSLAGGRSRNRSPPTRAGGKEGCDRDQEYQLHGLYRDYKQSTSIWSMVAVGGVERARESIRNDDLRTHFFVLFIY